MQSLTTLISACKIGMEYEKGLYLGDKVAFANNIARISNVGFELNLVCDLVDFRSSKEFLTIDSDEFLKASTILKSGFVASQSGDKKFKITGDCGLTKEVSLTKVPVASVLKTTVFKFPVVAELSIKDLETIKIMTAYYGSYFIIRNGFVHLNDKLIAIRMKSTCSPKSLVCVPFDVFKIVTEDIQKPLQIKIDNNRVGIGTDDSSLSIKYDHIEPPHYDPFLAASVFDIYLDKNLVSEILSEINKVKKFNSRVHLSKSTPSPDLQINFKMERVEFVNLRTKVKKSIITKCNKTASINTYGGLFSKVVKDCEGTLLRLSPKSTHGLIIDNTYIIGSINENY